MRSAGIVLALTLLVLCCTGCPPAPPPVNTTPVVTAPSTDPLRERLKETFKLIKGRQLDPSHGFWTVFHGILGLGPDLELYEGNSADPKNKKPLMKAIDYIRLGMEMKGLRFDQRGNGIEVWTATDTDVFFAQGHQDQFVAEMAQWGVSKDLAFKVDGKNYTFNDFINYTKQRSSVTKNQELAWALLIIAEYEGTKFSWTNQFSETLNVEDMVRQELESPLDPEDTAKLKQPPLACGGTHRLYGLSWALHRHLQDGGKLTGIWKKTSEKLDSLKKTVKNSRNPDGSFSTNYFSRRGDDANLGTRLSTTGHTFEWLAIALSDKEIREPWVEEAADYLTRLVNDLNNGPIDGGSLYHAVHGLLIYYARIYGTEDLGANTPYVRLAPGDKPVPWKAATTPVATATAPVTTPTAPVGTKTYTLPEPTLAAPTSSPKK